MVARLRVNLSSARVKNSRLRAEGSMEAAKRKKMERKNWVEKTKEFESMYMRVEIEVLDVRTKLPIGGGGVDIYI